MSRKEWFEAHKAERAKLGLKGPCSFEAASAFECGDTPEDAAYSERTSMEWMIETGEAA